MWEAIEADLARAGWAIEQIPQQLSWRAVYSMVVHSQPSDARYGALMRAAEVQEQQQMATDIHDTIADAKRMGWG